jgi:hypothetical protein
MYIGNILNRLNKKEKNKTNKYIYANQYKM